jgi:putative ABC transport system ATP-binding protein
VPVLQVADLAVSYRSIQVFRDFDLSVEAGESVAIIGPSGSGKSSILACITGMLEPTSGRVEIAGQFLGDLNSTGRARIRREHLGLMYQSPHLLPELTVIENVAVLMLLDGMDRADALAVARHWLKQVGLEDHEHKRVGEVSGGEGQRIAVARALARPKIQLLIADEPTASLDARNAALIADLILKCAEESNAGVVLATHDLSVAKKCSRVFDLTGISV